MAKIATKKAIFECTVNYILKICLDWLFLVNFNSKTPRLSRRLYKIQFPNDLIGQKGQKKITFLTQIFNIQKCHLYV